MRRLSSRCRCLFFRIEKKAQHGSAGLFCASRLRLGWEPARSKFLPPSAGRGEQGPSAIIGFDSGASVFCDLDEVARTVLNEAGGIQIEFGPSNAALNEWDPAFVRLNVEDGRERAETFLLRRLQRRLFHHRLTASCEHPQQRQEAFFNGGHGQRHWSFQPLEVSKSFMPSTGCSGDGR